MSLTLLPTPTPLEPKRYTEITPSTLDDWWLTEACWTQPRPVPVGVVWGERWVVLIGCN